MRRELEEAIAALAPGLYRYPGWADPMRSLLGFGFECDDGWFRLLADLTHALTCLTRDGGLHLEVRQVKEKFGGLRFYYDADGDGEARRRVASLVEEAERRSLVICEHCGRPGILRERRSEWCPLYRTLCNACARLWLGASTWDPWAPPPPAVPALRYAAPPADPPEAEVLAALGEDPERSPIWWLALDRDGRWWWASLEPAHAILGVCAPDRPPRPLRISASDPAARALEWARRAVPEALGVGSVREAVDSGALVCVAPDLLLWA
ncbi:protein of unknown function [Candidatus Hydrogenisulfobacillus filiaventi]|uniref:Uncharacterized protein n=1 Tax=Candidatus Hydrogenisulfobacillus filiaventi TaxID=2707344 RepID=A0A6F8ZIL5_9FIRM|nr:protein of unknown function [Candidatus Hydrogenisulfobacillus filiaventi]